MISSNVFIATVPFAKVSDSVLRQPLLLEKGDVSKIHFRISVSGNEYVLDHHTLVYIHTDFNLWNDMMFLVKKELRSLVFLGAGVIA